MAEYGNNVGRPGNEMAEFGNNAEIPEIKVLDIVH